MEYIKNLLLQTGWTCDDLIKKIQEYKIEFNEVNSNEHSSSIAQLDNRNEVISENCSTSDSHHHVSIVEVENDHSYTCRKTDIVGDYEMQKKMHKQDRRKFYEDCIKIFFEKRKIKYSRKMYYPRKVKRKYRLLLKHSTIDRKMLICKYKPQEVLRTEIMHQLELLRSKRTLGINSDITQTVISDQIFSKKRYSGDKIREEVISEIDDVSCKEICDTNNSYDNQSCWHKIKTLNKKEFPETNLDPYSIKPTKTNDITKIKGWKNKKFITLKSPTIENIASEAKNDSFENSSVTISKSDIISAFASTNLDGFLHESSNLHISFEIPTLDSGNSNRNVSENKDESQTNEAISTSPLVDKNEDKQVKIQKVDVLNLYRPRTVGQKKRIWKLKSDNRIKRKTDDATKPRTLAEKRRLLDNDMDIKSKSKTSDMYTENNLKYSYIIHRGKKLKVPTRTENNIVAYIKSHNGKKDYIYVPKKVKYNKVKPSIFAKTPVIQSQVIKYRPGPLSKKITLQEINKDWKAEIRQLPKIYLEVRPRSCKPIWPKIRHLLPQYGFELTEERISFALTALRSNDNMQSFTFPMHYTNKQESLLLRRRIAPVQETPLNTENNKTVGEIVENVMNKMLDYVETKNISEEVVRDDVTEKMMKEEENIINEQQNNVSRKRKTKQSKTNYELKRLNVKVIEVNLEDRGESDNCKKDFCRLGCVCKSLSTTSSLVSNHCGIPDCMFECKCNYEKKSKGNLKVTLPIGTDLLSEGAVNRLEVEAKKNLAKVEKEFTQTVIQANNQTIVVGGCTNRQRRVTKLPKKYTDFIDDPDGVDDTTEAIVENTNSNIHLDEKFKNWKPVPCTVQLTKLNLGEVIPYCMVHLLHNCYCDYSASYDIQKDEMKLESTAIKSDTNALNDKPIKDGSFENDFEITNSCARTKGLPTNYYLVRNKTEKFIASRRRKLDKIYRDYMDKEEKLKVSKETEDVNVYIADEVPKIDEKDTSKNILGNERKIRRKQNLLIRRDSSPLIQRQLIKISENAIQRRKKSKKYITNHSENSIPLPISQEKGEEHIDKSTNALLEEQPHLLPEKNPDYQERLAKFNQIFEIENPDISSSNSFIPSTTIQEKLKEILGKNVGSHTQFRFIPWNILVTKYEDRSLQLWYSTFFKKPRIIATDNKTIPKHFINVRNYENIANKDVIKADLIRWLVSRTLPDNNCKENIFVIVQLTKTHCELCGLWEKKQNSSTDKMVLISQTIDNYSCTDNKKYSIVKKIMFSRCKFSKQMLIEPICSADELKKIPAMSAYLPQISNNTKWRMIKLNSDFSVLSLHRNKYAIKYSDLQKVMKMARETSYTIVLKTPEVETNYPHPDFGMYASPECDDIIFIGPYYNHEDHDIITLRYANGELIRTDLYCKMNGRKPACSGIWLYQILLTTLNQDNVQTIDLTECESDHELKTKQEDKQEISTNRSLLKLKVDEEYPSKKKKRKDQLINCTDLVTYESHATNYYVPTGFYKYMPEEVNINSYMQESVIYFVPNIPKMGFIVGHNLHNSVIVRWPSLRWAIKFPDVTNAIKYLERELNTYFIRKPGQISVQALPEIDTSKVEMFDSEILLKGYYIASYMGVIPLLDINKSTLRHLRMTLSETEELAKERAKRMIFDKCFELGKKLFSPSKLGQPSCSDTIIQMIIDEIKQQETLEHELLVCQSKLIEKKQTLRLKCTAVIKELTPLVSSKMQNAMKKILNFNKSISEPKHTTTTNDVICIDVDTDEDVRKEAKEKPPAETSTSSPSSIPKISVKKLQDLKEPSTSTNHPLNSANIKSFSILKTKSSNKDYKVSVNGEVRKTQTDVSHTPIVRSSEINPTENKTVTIKRTVLNKKCSKFVIKTSTGKYMTIRAQNLKELPVKKLQPIAPNDPVISKLNTMNTKRIIVPANHNGFVKVNFNDKQSRLNEKIISKPVIENVQPSYQSSSENI